MTYLQNKVNKGQEVIVNTTQRSPANKKQIPLIILELSDLDHRIGSFSPTQYVQKKVN